MTATSPSMVRALTALVVLAGTVLAGCGLPADSAPREFARDDVPFDLLEPPTTRPSTTTTDPAATREVPVYLKGRERLVRVARRVEADATVRDVLLALLEGPTNEEADEGVATALSANVELVAVSLSAGVATVDFNEALLEIQGDQQLFAIAQVVFTATDISGVRGVRFRIDRQEVEVPRGDGSLTPGPLTQADYPGLDPDAPPAPEPDPSAGQQPSPEGPEGEAEPAGAPGTG